jgi:AraC-like DNA-binding protein/mannose-6-phosphate isomerase-like protein (cupin superfamily)
LRQEPDEELEMKRSADLPMDIRPVVAMSDEYPSGSVDPVHTHPRAQLSLALSGVLSFTMNDASYLLPSNRAIWIPAGMPHSVRFRGKVVGLTIYIEPDLAGSLARPKIFAVSPLMRALIEEVTTFKHAYDIEGREGRIVQFLLEEIEKAPEATMQVPMPLDARLRRVCDVILAEPSVASDLDDCSQIAGMGRRTFTRLFKQQLGMGLATWRQQVRIMEAVSLLSTGLSITSVAFEVGYESASAFTAMFHRTVGAPPSAFYHH